MLTLNSTLADLPTHDFRVSVTTLGVVVEKKFHYRPDLPGVLITADGQFVGMISRSQFFEWLSRPYGLETFLKRPIKAMWKMIAETESLTAERLLEKYLVLSGHCSIDKAAELALNRPLSLAYEPIVVNREGGDLRLLDIQVLLLAQSQLFALAKEAADAANTAKSDFLANMSHELRTPLNAILGFTQIMSRDRSLSVEHQQYLDIINHSGEHLLDLINDILQMSKIEAGRVTLNVNAFDLYGELASVTDMLHFKALSKGLKLIVDCAPDVPQYIQTDERKLREILLNLLGNAIKFTQKGSITLRVRVGEWESGRVGEGVQGRSSHPYLLTPSALESKVPHLSFEVEDTGAGIAPEEMNKLFTAFGQTQTGRSSQEGTGLGLAISQKFVQLMGGNISVRSTPGKGTTFAFDIQIAQAQASEIQAPQETRKVISIAPNPSQYRILVVDDHSESRLLLVKLLNSVGFDVREAANGQEAIEQWLSYSPHLIFMDMRMPIMDGYKATERIKGHLQGQTTSIIALTASALDEERMAILSAGCDDCIRKPFQEALIWEKIAQHLGVQYLYEESAARDNNQGTFNQAGTADQSLDVHLSQMPSWWVEKLERAALKCLDHAIVELIQEIPEAHAPLANALEDWANNFLFDRIIDLIQQTQTAA